MDEFELIRKYFLNLATEGERVVLGIGDDAALLAPSAGNLLAVTTDTLVEGRHFRAGADPEMLGWKSLAVNLSDLAAMGATPRWFSLSLTLPDAEPRWLEGFSAGLRAAADAFGIALVGGDTTRGPRSITITAHGEVPAETALRRSGARIGDSVCVSGTVGDAALALYLSEQGVEVRAWLQERLHRPWPRIELGQASRGVASAAIDISDGLAQDLGHVLLASGVGAELDLDRIPRSEAFSKDCPPTECARLMLAGGDDYELCVCLPDSAVEALAGHSSVALTRIGRIVAEPGLRVFGDHGDKISIPESGFRHFK